MSNGWSDWVSDGEAAARAAGRRKYNALRRDRARYRRIQVAELVMSDGWTYGFQARIAEELGVSHSTVSRDLRVLFPAAIQCPVRVPTSPGAVAGAGAAGSGEVRARPVG